MIAIPDLVTHRYHPYRGPCRNLCSLSDDEASQILDCLRRDSLPTLKPDYLIQRRMTEKWLASEASRVFGRSVLQPPVYFFLGDFSWFPDLSRPSSLVIPLASLSADAITFTLGDSMTVARQSSRKAYKFAEIAALFDEGEAIAEFGFSDRSGFQSHFIEVQLWDSSSLFSYMR